MSIVVFAIITETDVTIMTTLVIVTVSIDLFTKRIAQPDSFPNVPLPGPVPLFQSSCYYLF